MKNVSELLFLELLCVLVSLSYLSLFYSAPHYLHQDEDKFWAAVVISACGFGLVVFLLSELCAYHLHHLPVLQSWQDSIEVFGSGGFNGSEEIGGAFFLQILQINSSATFFLV